MYWVNRFYSSLSKWIWKPIPNLISLLFPENPITFVVEYSITNSRPTDVLKYKTGPPENEKVFSLCPMSCPFPVLLPYSYLLSVNRLNILSVFRK